MYHNCGICCKYPQLYIRLTKQHLMKIGILGTGIVGTTLGSHLIKKGHAVTLGSRKSGNENAMKWVKENGNKGYAGSFKEAAFFGDIAFNCTMGIASLEALKMAGTDSLKKKILVDVANPVDYTVGMPPSLTVCNDNSLGEQIQRLLPDTNVVKALNTVNYEVMVDPSKINNGQIDSFICGENALAKQTVKDFLVKEFGWKRESIIDLGGIVHARGMEALLLLFVSMAMKYGTFYNGIRVLQP